MGVVGTHRIMSLLRRKQLKSPLKSPTHVVRVPLGSDPRAHLGSKITHACFFFFFVGDLTKATHDICCTSTRKRKRVIQDKRLAMNVFK